MDAYSEKIEKGGEEKQNGNFLLHPGTQRLSLSPFNRGLSSLLHCPNQYPPPSLPFSIPRFTLRHPNSATPGFKNHQLLSHEIRYTHTTRRREDCGCFHRRPTMYHDHQGLVVAYREEEGGGPVKKAWLNHGNNKEQHLWQQQRG